MKRTHGIKLYVANVQIPSLCPQPGFEHAPSRKSVWRATYTRS